MLLFCRKRGAAAQRLDQRRLLGGSVAETRRVQLQDPARKLGPTERFVDREVHCRIHDIAHGVGQLLRGIPNQTA